MSILHVENFNKYAAIADIGTDNDANDVAQYVVNSTPIFQSGHGRFGGKSIEFDRQVRDLAVPFQALTANTTVIIGVAIKYEANYDQVQTLTLTRANDPVIYMYNGSATLSAGIGTDVHWAVGVGPGGGLYFYNTGDYADPLFVIGRVFNLLQPHVWHYLEIKVVMTDTGTMTVKLDGVQIFQATSTDFLATNLTGSFIHFAGTVGGGKVQFEDIIVMDGAGSTFNDFKGDMRFESTVPDADGATVQWTPSAGSNFQCIDDALPLAHASFDTDFISETTTDDVNLASHVALSMTNATTVHFMRLEAIARGDAAAEKIRLRVESSASNAESGDIALDSTTVAEYRWRYHHFEQDPNGPIAWATAAANAAEWGVKKRV